MQDASLETFRGKSFDPKAARPNVLLICTDHWPGALLRPAGHPTIMTPTLEMLARNGVMFTRAYSACPVCAPARRTIMTGLSPRSHGINSNRDIPWNPNVPSLAQRFRDGGYQAYAVGKLHVTPPRCRIGFDDVILNEEGRLIDGHGDDWDRAVADAGYPGQTFVSGMASNDYLARPWPLPERLHPTNWSVEQMCRTISRRDPTRPGFWYLSLITPHPPLQPPTEYLEMYRDVPIDEPLIGEWARDPAKWPYFQRWQNAWYSITNATKAEREMAIRAFYATCTHIDHQLRLVIGTLREQGILKNTVIAFTADHGDMLGQHGLWAKQHYYDLSARVPMIVVPAAGDTRLTPGTRDDRVVELRDLMPTLLDLAGQPVPAGVDGYSLLTPKRREYLYGEVLNGAQATRMIRDERFKLIYFAGGNRLQLFDMNADPNETRDLSADGQYAGEVDRLTRLLIENFAEADRAWVKDGLLVGVAEPELSRDTRDLGNQRGIRYI